MTADFLPYDSVPDGCLDTRLGVDGLSARDLAAVGGAVRQSLDRLRAEHDGRRRPFLALANEAGDLAALEKTAAVWRRDFSDLLVLGTGGSSLGGRTLSALAGPDAKPAHFADNIDPAGFERILRRLDPLATHVLAISKSGGTAETLLQLVVVLAWLDRAGADPARHVTLVTEPNPSPFRRLGEARGAAVLDHHPALGGRFSVLSLVGLLPALFQGLDGRKLRDGAASVLDATLEAPSWQDAPPALGAALHVLFQRRDAMQATVLMPYLDGLETFTLWFRQLWAESLGKDGQGLTPIAARGAVDQHSQLQLYLAGPRDKVFTVIAAAARGRGPGVPADIKDPELAYLAGRTMGDLCDAEQRATVEALIRRKRPVRVLALDALDETSMGGLLMHYMLETVIAADLMGVNPYDQPAVEEGKALARAYLGDLAKNPPQRKP